MPKKKSQPVADQFSDHEMDQVKRYGQALSGGVTPFDEEVERHLARYEAKRKKLEATKGCCVSSAQKIELVQKKPLARHGTSNRIGRLR